MAASGVPDNQIALDAAERILPHTAEVYQIIYQAIQESRAADREAMATAYRTGDVSHLRERLEAYGAIDDEGRIVERG